MGGLLANTVILTIGELITKVLGLVIRIISVRVVGEEGIGILMLVMPTFVLFMALASMGLPIAISRLVSTDKYDNKKLVLGIVPITLALNVIWISLLLLLAPFLSGTLLKNDLTFYPLMAIGFVLPFITISSILRGYYFGKQQMMPHIISLIVEQIVRIVLLILIIPVLMQVNLVVAIVALIISTGISELASIIVMIKMLPKKNAKKEYFKFDKKLTKLIFATGAPATGSRLIGSFSYFLEPIILTLVLTKVGFSLSYIVTEYAIISAYTFPLLLIPSFFMLALSNAVVPVVSKAFQNKQYAYLKKKVKQTLIGSFIIGLITTFILISFTKPLLELLFNTTQGVRYIQVLAPWFLLYYIQVPVTAILQSMGYAKQAMTSTLFGAIFKTLAIAIFAWLGFGILALVIATVINLLIVTIDNSRILYNKLKVLY